MVVTRSMAKKGGGSKSKTSIITNSVIAEEKLRPRKSQRVPFQNVDNGAELRFLRSEYVEIPSTDDELSVHTSDEKASTYDFSDDQAISDDGSEDDIELILNYNDSSTVNESDHSSFAVADKDHKDDVHDVKDVEDVVEEDDDQDEDYRDEDQNSKDFYDENDHDDNSTESIINDIKYCTGRNCCANLQEAILFYENMQQFFDDQKKRREISLNEIFSFWNKSSN
ncbi:hypothetical protein BDK51DRAFT_28636 [Blyttiomyces helicus]|uniref:Uncharacterized protein n=1 Tax=Blyttiomyces helicus TaxID=388810 RepID=A0A4P9WPT8_9FUNG|nr:hypothetical protein BDK51DRAFT_28636 [Blyttiomyces helicus]|eukprot:RKO92836.1 hypothetical protein BDK51DRAFT_28636 [Blyttiomyces helicus]